MAGLKQKAEIARALGPYLPEGTAETIAEWIVGHRVQFVVAKPRQSKLGDFRAGNRHMPSRISVNGDLNPYAFLITTVHEFAHLACYSKYGRKVAPHGKEWKQLYTDMLQPFVNGRVFPAEIHEALLQHISSPKASSCSCPTLNKAMALHDDQEVVFLESTTTGIHFLFRDECYEVVEKRRTRFLCKRLRDGKNYLISGRATIEPLPQQALQP